MCGLKPRPRNESAQQEEGFELYPHDAAKAERGARAAVIGAVAGIIPAIGLGCVRVLNSESPEVAAQLAGNIAFALMYASPYLLALIASGARDPGVRGGLLAAIGLLSLVASFSDFSRRPSHEDRGRWRSDSITRPAGRSLNLPPLCPPWQFRELDFHREHDRETNGV